MTTLNREVHFSLDPVYMSGTSVYHPHSMEQVEKRTENSAQRSEIFIN